MNKILVCPVVYNENVKIKSVIERFLKSKVYGQVDFMVIDDCSDDDTTDIIKSFGKHGVRTIKHNVRSGVGAAIRTAIGHALKQGYEILVIMAGNDKDNPDEISQLTDPITFNGYDFVQGSRYLNPHGIGSNMPKYRVFATKLHPKLMSHFTKRKLTDTTNGFRAFKLSIFENANIDIDQEWLNQYELEPYLLYKVLTLGFKFLEAPVTKIYPPKKLGYTKMKPVTGWWSILKPVLYLGLKIKK